MIKIQQIIILITGIFIPNIVNAYCPAPIPPKFCSCSKTEHRTICLIIIPPPPCIPCLNGCNSDGVCNDEIPVNNGLPLNTVYKNCFIGNDWGICEDDVNIYWWICDNYWCVDVNNTYWPNLNQRD